jgi:hypothetical protein
VPTKIVVARVRFNIRFREAGQNSKVNPLVTYFTFGLNQTVTSVLSTIDICRYIGPELVCKLPFPYVEDGM